MEEEQGTWPQWGEGPGPQEQEVSTLMPALPDAATSWMCCSSSSSADTSTGWGRGGWRGRGLGLIPPPPPPVPQATPLARRPEGAGLAPTTATKLRGGPGEGGAKGTGGGASAAGGGGASVGVGGAKAASTAALLQLWFLWRCCGRSPAPLRSLIDRSGVGEGLGEEEGEGDGVGRPDSSPSAWKTESDQPAGQTHPH